MYNRFSHRWEKTCHPILIGHSLQKEIKKLSDHVALCTADDFLFCAVDPAVGVLHEDLAGLTLLLPDGKTFWLANLISAS